jgi:hypothetical protein
MFENRVLRRLFGPKRDEVTEGWKKLYNKELHEARRRFARIMSNGSFGSSTLNMVF